MSYSEQQHEQLTARMHTYDVYGESMTTRMDAIEVEVDR